MGLQNERNCDTISSVGAGRTSGRFLACLRSFKKSLKKEVGMKLKTLLPAALSVFLSAPVYAATGTTSGTASSIPLPSAPDMTPVYGLAGILLSAGVGLFAVRKVIKLMNRS